MLMNCYYVKNTLSKLSDGIMLYPTDAFAVAQVSRQIIGHREDVNEYELHKIAQFDTETSKLYPIDDVLVPFSTREVAESPSENDSVKDAIKNINSVR